MDLSIGMSIGRRLIYAYIHVAILKSIILTRLSNDPHQTFISAKLVEKYLKIEHPTWNTSHQLKIQQTGWVYMVAIGSIGWFFSKYTYMTKIYIGWYRLGILIPRFASPEAVLPARLRGFGPWLGDEVPQRSQHNRNQLNRFFFFVGWLGYINSKHDSTANTKQHKTMIKTCKKTWIQMIKCSSNPDVWGFLMDVDGILKYSHCPFPGKEITAEAWSSASWPRWGVDTWYRSNCWCFYGDVL